jgi:hypothetical protein
MLSLYRNYISNEFSLKFDSPDDFFNLTFPFALGIALCYFGVYKDVVFKLLRFKSKRDHYEELRDKYQKESDYYAKLAIDQNQESIKSGETTPYSADLKMLINRYEGTPRRDSMYEVCKQVILILSKSGVPLPHVQVVGTIGEVSIFQTTDAHGLAILEWNSDSEFLDGIHIGTYRVSGKWADKQEVRIDVDGFSYTPALPTNSP